MRLFDPNTRTSSPRNARIYAAYEVVYTAVDFAAALLFVIGSILFFGETTQAAGTWLFLLGSICFALKPTIRLAREIYYLRTGYIDALAQRGEKEP